MEWIQIKWKPSKPGQYLVTTANRRVIIDRWDGESWARCIPRHSSKRIYAGYPMHLAWAPLPTPYKEIEE